MASATTSGHCHPSTPMTDPQNGQMTCEYFMHNKLRGRRIYHAYVLNGAKRPHDGWLDMAKPFIDAFHAGNTSIDGFVESDQLIYWYRTTLRDVSCSATDNCGSPPDGWQTMADSVFVVSLLKSPGTVTVTSGSLPPVSFNATAGASSFSAPMGVGPQGFALNRDGQNVLNGTSLHDVSSVCTCGFYNFNAFVGTLPPSFSDPLGPDSLTSFSSGLPAPICEARPSLATAMPYQTSSCQPPGVDGGA